MPALLIGCHHQADVLTIKLAEYSKHPPASNTHTLFHPTLLPVLIIFLTTRATWPFSMELSSLTMKMRQLLRMRIDKASRMRPTARSSRFTSTKR